MLLIAMWYNDADFLKVKIQGTQVHPVAPACMRVPMRLCSM